MHLTTYADLNHKPLTPTGVGAPELTEIETTPAMVSAGASALVEASIDEAGVYETASKVYSVMNCVRAKANHADSAAAQ